MVQSQRREGGCWCWFIFCGTSRLEFFFCFLGWFLGMPLLAGEEISAESQHNCQIDKTSEQAKSLGGRRCLVRISPLSLTCIQLRCGAGVTSPPPSPGQPVRMFILPRPGREAQRGRPVETYRNGVERGSNVTAQPAGGQPLWAAPGRSSRGSHTHLEPVGKATKILEPFAKNQIELD